MQSGGIERSYILRVPPQYDGSQPTALVLNFHGFGSNAAEQALYSRFPQKADEAGFILVTPDGTGTPRHWNLIPGQQPDEVAFVRELLDRLESGLCIDTTRVFATGMSNGAALSSRLACALSDRITAAAPVAALVYPVLLCNGTESPTAIIAFHGTDDACVPFEGGTSTCGMGFTIPPIAAAAENWARHNGCDVAASRTQLTEHVRVVAYSGCREEASVILYVVEGGGHTWPGSASVPRLGGVTSEIDATDLIWEFFVGQGNLQ